MRSLVLMNFRNVEQLAACVRANLYRIPRSVGLIVGVPRSGILPAILIANHLDLPHLTLDEFVEGRRPSFGRRMGGTAGRVAGSCPQVLIVDDSVASGAENARIRAKLGAMQPRANNLLAAAYVAPGKESLVDLFFEIVPEPRMFEWNIGNHYLLPSSCVDIDGVLCRDPIDAENDDGPAYERFLETTEPMIRPGKKIGWLVTSRLEKYRRLTEAWLREQGIEYGELCMLNLPSQAERIRRRAHATFKSKIYNRTPSSLFIESAPRQSDEIVRLTGKPVLCLESARLLLPNPKQVLGGQIRRLAGSLRRRIEEGV